MRTEAEKSARLPARGEMARRLRREGLLAGPSPARDCRRFRVAVLDLEAADIHRLLPGRQDGRTMMPDDRLRRIVTRAAVRALYILGLDAGQVVVDTDDRGRAWVAGVSDHVRLSSGEGEHRWAMARAARSGTLAAKGAGGETCAVLGADPEFVLTQPDGKVVSAARFLPQGGMAGCDSIVRRGVKIWPLAELRPDPSPEPAELADRIRRLLAEMSRRIGPHPLIWRAGALPVRGLPLGGHIHISGVPLSGERLRALDNAVALPLRLLEPPGASARRPRYGALGDFRRQPHGGFEYRTPPSWLVSRQLALGVLALAKIAAEHAAELSCGRPLDDDGLRDAFYGEGRESELREAFLGYFERIRETGAYRKYQAEAEYVREMVRSGRRWDEAADFRSGWGIRA